MRSVIVDRGRLLPPFGTPVSQACLLGRTLREEQQRVLGECGLPPAEVRSAGSFAGEPATPEPTLWIEGDQYVSVGALRQFLQEIRGATRPTALGLAVSPTTAWCGVLGGGSHPEAELVRQGVAWLPPGRVPETLREGGGPAAELPPLARVEPGGQQATFPAPHGSAQPDLVIPAPARLALPIRHWVHLLLANLLGFSAAVQEPAPWRTGLRLLGGVLRARSLNPFVVAGKLNRVGRNCLIHPRAVVEGCWLGDRVRVGANSVLQGCVLGDDVAVEELATAALSVFGRGARLQRLAICRFSTVFPGAEVAGGVQLSVLGERASIKHASFTLDMAFGGRPIRALLDGALVDCGLPFLGACLGHDVLVGSGVHLGPGREIPNGYKVIQSPDRLLLEVPGDLDRTRPAWVEQGRLVQVRRVRRD